MLILVVKQQLWQSLLDYWRNREDAAFEPGTVIDLSQWSNLWGCWPILIATKGRLYVREEYGRMYQRLVAASKAVDRIHQGVVVTGQPGVGE